MSERVGIVGSRTYPSPEDIVAYVAALPAGTVIVSGGANGADAFAADAARRAGLGLAVHLPDLAKYGSPSAYYHRNLAIVNDSDRVLAFAAKDKRTKQITAGTQMAIDLARRAGVPVEVVETPVPARVCDLIARLRHRYDGIRDAPTASHAAYRVRSAYGLVGQLVRVRAEFEGRLRDGWQEIDATEDAAERDAKEAAWCDVLLPTYRIVSDAVAEAMAVLGPLTAPDRPLHRSSLHRGAVAGVVACP